MVIFITTTTMSSKPTHKLLFGIVPSQFQIFIALWDEGFDFLPWKSNPPPPPPLHCLDISTREAEVLTLSQKVGNWFNWFTQWHYVLSQMNRILKTRIPLLSLLCSQFSPVFVCRAKANLEGQDWWYLGNSTETTAEQTGKWLQWTGNKELVNEYDTCNSLHENM
jgi:hypothetical protein